MSIDDQLRLGIAEDLAGTFKGEIIGPDHVEYEHSRQLWNAMVDRRPGLILRCGSTQDVVAAVAVAREHGLLPAVRCGGHNVAGRPGRTAAICHMLNLMRFFDELKRSGRAGHGHPSGANAHYEASAAPMLVRGGGYPVLAGSATKVRGGSTGRATSR
jgi:hypothetical protein